MSRKSFTTNNSSLFGKSSGFLGEGENTSKEISFAVPKGAKTRSAMAIHLANKLKIDPNVDPSSIFK